jgi:uncharacterized protein
MIVTRKFPEATIEKNNKFRKKSSGFNQSNPSEARTDPQNETQSLLEQIKHFAKMHFRGARGSHDWDHTLRVHQLCRRIGKKEGVDMTVLLSAALLHDIGRSYQDAANGAICHADEGARLAGPLLQRLPLSKMQSENILHCIRAHRFRGSQVPETKEAKVLFDADKLDAIGAVGIARAFLFAGEVGARLHNSDTKPEDTTSYSPDDTGYREFKVKLSKIKERMLTNEGRKLAAGRHVFMVDFFSRFIQEYKGKG